MSAKGFSPTTERSLDDYRYDIAEYIKTNGPYSHNLISLTLEIVEKYFGPRACLQIIKDFNLSKDFGIADSNEIKKAKTLGPI